MIEKYNFFYDEVNNLFQLRTRENAFSIRFDDDEKKAILQEILNFSAKKGFRLDKVVKHLSSFNPNKVQAVLSELRENDIIPDYTSRESIAKEKSESRSLKDGIVHLVSDKDYSKITTDKKICVIGSGDVFKAMKSTYDRQSLKKVKFANFPKNQLQAYIDKEIGKHDFFILEAHAWNPKALKIFNKLALKHNKPWLLIFGAFEGQAIIGPIFHGKETGCYSCFLSRFKSNIDNHTYFNSYEKYLSENNLDSGEDWIPPGFNEVISSLALYEATKFLTNWDITELYGNIITVNFSLGMRKHKLLKNPLCPDCRPELEYNISPWLDKVTLN